MVCCISIKFNALINENIVAKIEAKQKDDLKTNLNVISKGKDKTSKKNGSIKRSKFIKENVEQNKTPISI